MLPRHIALLLAFAVIISACQTVTPEQRRAADLGTCRGYGFKPGTEGMATCLMNQELDRRAQARAMWANTYYPMWW